MRLLLIITDYGSFNNFLSELVIKMRDKGHEIDVLCSDEKVINVKDKYDYAGMGINIHFAAFPRGFNVISQFKASLQIHKLINRISPDLIHIHFTTGIFTTVFYKKPATITIGTIHGLGFPMVKGLRRFIFKCVEFFAIKRLDSVWVLNNYDYNILKMNNKTFMIDSVGLGCNLKKFNINLFDHQKINVRENLGINNEDFVIAYTGRFVNFKGFDLVVRSFLELNKNYPSTFKLILIGGNDSIHPSGLTRAEENAYLSDPDIVKIGFTNEVEKYLAVSDVFLFPSLKEGMPVCIIEALSMGKPVITANTRGCNDLIQDQINGILLSDKPTADEIVNAVLLLKNTPELLAELGNNALKNRESYSREVFIDKQIKVYDSILKT